MRNVDPGTYGFTDAGDGRFVLTGSLGFFTARRILEASEAAFPKQPAVVVDLTGVTHADSAGLAVLLEWVTWAHHSGTEIRFQGVPKQVRAIAHISEVEGLLEPGETLDATVVVVRPTQRN